MADAGHEIGGHTLDHRSLTTLSAADARTQVCDDRAALIRQGYAAAAFAYPSGLFNSTVKTIVSDCGYTTARTTGGLDYPNCCVYSSGCRRRCRWRCAPSSRACRRRCRPTRT